MTTDEKLSFSSKKKTGPSPMQNLERIFSSPTSGYEVHAPIKFDWLGVIIGYPYTHSIPHPPPIVNYFFKKLSLKQKKTRVTHAERNPCSMDDRLGFPPDLLLVYHRRSPLSTPMAKKKQKKKREFITHPNVRRARASNGTRMFAHGLNLLRLVVLHLFL